jgi:hypothetical protein
MVVLTPVWCKQSGGYQREEGGRGGREKEDGEREWSRDGSNERNEMQSKASLTLCHWHRNETVAQSALLEAKKKKKKKSVACFI